MMAATVLLGTWVVLAFAAGPAASNYALYQRVGQHATQMQTWKKGTKSYIVSLRNLADGILANTLVNAHSMSRFPAPLLQTLPQPVTPLNMRYTSLP